MGWGERKGRGNCEVGGEEEKKGKERRERRGGEFADVITTSQTARIPSRLKDIQPATVVTSSTSKISLISVEQTSIYSQLTCFTLLCYPAFNSFMS